jgi:hypothetical protein
MSTSSQDVKTATNLQSELSLLFQYNDDEPDVCRELMEAALRECSLGLKLILVRNNPSFISLVHNLIIEQAREASDKRREHANAHIKMLKEKNKKCNILKEQETRRKEKETHRKEKREANTWASINLAEMFNRETAQVEQKEEFLELCYDTDSRPVTTPDWPIVSNVAFTEVCHGKTRKNKRGGEMTIINITEEQLDGEFEIEEKVAVNKYPERVGTVTSEYWFFGLKNPRDEWFLRDTDGYGMPIKWRRNRGGWLTSGANAIFQHKLANDGVTWLHQTFDDASGRWVLTSDDDYKITMERRT